MKVNVTYNIVNDLCSKCEELIDKYQYDNSLGMDIEWALWQNFKKFQSTLRQCQEDIQALEKEYGSLQENGSSILERDNEAIMTVYNRALERLMNRKFKLDINKVNHKVLTGKAGMTLETMSFFDWMIF